MCRGGEGLDNTRDDNTGDDSKSLRLAFSACMPCKL